MDFDTHGTGLTPVEELHSFDASLLSAIIHDDNDNRDMTDWHFDMPDDLPIYDATTQLPQGSTTVDVMWDQQDDPLNPRNLPSFLPETDDDLLQRCLRVSKGRFYALVDRDLHAQLSRAAWRIYCDESGETYRRYIRKGGGTVGTVYLHREVMALHLARCPEYRNAKCAEFGLNPALDVEVLVPQLIARGVVHHLNHNTEDNRLANLDLVAEVDNRRQTRAQPSSTGFRGIAFEKQRYRARVQRHSRNGRKSREVGFYEKPDIAALARCLFLLVYWRVWFVKAFTPTSGEEQLWRNVVHMLHHGSGPHYGWIETDLPARASRLLEMARKRAKSGQIAQVKWRG